MAKKTFKDKFQRIETKYVISKETLADLLQEFEAYMAEDEHAYSTIGNLYYDTPLSDDSGVFGEALFQGKIARAHL